MSTKAKQLLDEWIKAEEDIDKQRAEVIVLLLKKVDEIQRQRTASRQTIKDSIKLYEQFKTKNNDNAAPNIHP